MGQANSFFGGGPTIFFTKHLDNKGWGERSQQKWMEKFLIITISLFAKVNKGVVKIQFIAHTMAVWSFGNIVIAVTLLIHPMCESLCVFRLNDSEKALSHWVQINSFSCV